MPFLASLLDQGRWLRVESPACVGSGSVWPSLITGETPAEHGVYGEWRWQAETMSLARYNGRGLRPFWQKLAEDGVTVGILDVPFARLVGIREGFEITEWGPHDCLEGQMSVGPKQIEHIVAQHTAHPLSSDRLDAAGPSDYHGLRKLGEGCLRGVQLRGALTRQLLAETLPQFALIVFTEIHHSAHHLWHTIEPDHQVYNNDHYHRVSKVKPTLTDIYTEVDRQIGALINAAERGTQVLVFSLHGMRPTHGIPAFLGDALCKAGFAELAAWQTKGWKDRAREVLAELKRRTPASVKKVYYKTLPQSATYRVAQTTMLPSYDWSRTRAFSLPSDQHGWVRINLAGREAQGSVAADEYTDVCDDLERLLLGLTDLAGDRLVSDVSRPSRNVEAALASRLPDLIAHWNDAALQSPLQIKGFNFVAHAIGTKFTGQHSMDGFCIYRGDNGFVEGDVLRATEMAEVMMRMALPQESVMSASQSHRASVGCRRDWRTD
jgi:predicted AlkP superfamily phosphohydrolase/phosphomutase